MKIKTFSMICVMLTSINALADKVLAVVNNEPILESSLKQYLKSKKNLTQEDYTRAFNTLIDQTLLNQFQRDPSVQVQKEEVNKVIQDIMQRNNIPTYNQLIRILRAQGMTESKFKADIVSQLQDSKKKQVLFGDSGPFENEIHRVAEELSNQQLSKNIVMPKVKEYKIKHILLKVTPIFSDQEAREKLLQLRQEIQANNTSFEDAAKKESQDYYSGSKGGELGWARLEEYDPAFAKVAAATKFGSVSVPFKSRYGWHIMLVEDSRVAEMSRNEYFFIQAQKKLQKNTKQNFDKVVLDQLRNNANITIVNE